jgi:hypothetical protein
LQAAAVQEASALRQELEEQKREAARSKKGADEEREHTQQLVTRLKVSSPCWKTGCWKDKGGRNLGLAPSAGFVHTLIFTHKATESHD